MPMPAKLTTELFIERSTIKHNNRYDYSRAHYINNRTKITIICPVHGEFQQVPRAHLHQGKGCKQCNKPDSRTTEQAVSELQAKFGDSLLYDRVVFTKYDAYITLGCPIHGYYEQRFDTALSGTGCPSCRTTVRNTQSGFIEAAKAVHGDLYDYSKANYIDLRTHVTITCKKHGDFKQTPTKHILNGRGCHTCKASHGERLIGDLLSELGIVFIKEHKLCKNPNSSSWYRLDFFIPALKKAIEFDGIQHFEPVAFFGGIEKFTEVQFSDTYKADYCKANNIELLRINYQHTHDETVTLINKFISE